MVRACTVCELSADFTTSQAIGGQVPELTFVRAAPSAFLLLHLCLVIFAVARKPTWARNAWNTASGPFRNFLHLQDLLEPADLKPRNTLVEQRLLSSIACLELLVWIARAAFECYLEKYTWTTVYTLYALSWVSSTRIIPVLPLNSTYTRSTLDWHSF